jgi:hypothetical protein
MEEEDEYSALWPTWVSELDETPGEGTPAGNPSAQPRHW